MSPLNFSGPIFDVAQLAHLYFYADSRSIRAADGHHTRSEYPKCAILPSQRFYRI